jgi:hypothetical protein
MRRIVLAVAVGLLAGSAVAQNAVDNGAVQRKIQQLEVDVYGPPVTIYVLGLKDSEGEGIQYAEYRIATNDGIDQWCRTEQFDLIVTPGGASLTFTPEIEESCPEPRQVTVVCRVRGDRTGYQDTCNHRVNYHGVGQNAHDMAREMWEMDCSVAVGEFAADDAWGRAFLSHSQYTQPAN